MVQDIIKQVDPKMDKALDHLREELRSLRTGRASTALVENLMVENYGQQMPLKTVATISTPDAHTIAISPWDRNLVAPIEKLIRENQTLGLNPSSDGNVVRLNIPPMTEERRREIVKELGTKVEQCHVSMRNVRHEALNDARRLEKDKQASQDDVKWAENELGKKIDSYKQKVDEIAKAKEAEIMAV
jgi:ribosome recycling factor